MTMHRDLPEAVDELRGRVERLEAMIPKTVSASSPVAHENKGGDIGEWRLLQPGETVSAGDEYRDPYGEWKPIQGWMAGYTTTFARSDRGEFRRRVPPPAPGLRTERVTLDVTYDGRMQQVVEVIGRAILKHEAAAGVAVANK